MVGQRRAAARRGPWDGRQVRQPYAPQHLARAAVVTDPGADRRVVGAGEPGRHGRRRGRAARGKIGQRGQGGEPAQRHRFRLPLPGAGQQQPGLQLGDPGQPVVERHRVLPAAAGVAHQVDLTDRGARHAGGGSALAGQRQRGQIHACGKRVEQGGRDRHRARPGGRQRGQHPVGIADQIPALVPHEVQAAVGMAQQQRVVAQRPTAVGVGADQQRGAGVLAVVRRTDRPRRGRQPAGGGQRVRCVGDAQGQAARHVVDRASGDQHGLRPIRADDQQRRRVVEHRVQLLLPIDEPGAGLLLHDHRAGVAPALATAGEQAVERRTPEPDRRDEDAGQARARQPPKR
ncbi:hypothetical protein B0E54_02805 [Micromonospora sp. MH99]|nr:hypothetical protein [Micromonospora sp. MH99]